MRSIIEQRLEQIVEKRSSLALELLELQRLLAGYTTQETPQWLAHADEQEETETRVVMEVDLK